MYKKSKGIATAKFKQSLSTKLHASKKHKNPFSIALLVDEFVELITAAEAEEKSITADVDEKVTGDEAEQDSGDDQPQEEEEVDKVKEYRVVSKTLKGFIKESFDYQLLLQRMESLQDSCHKAIHGLSTNITILVGLVLDNQFTAAAQYFDYSSIDLHHRGIGADTHRMVVLGDIDQNSLQSVLDVLSTHLQQDHRAPSHTVSGSRVAVDKLLFRIHLCSHGFFNPKTYKKRASKDKQKKKQQRTSHKNATMERLFWSLVKENRKEHVVIHFCERFFAFSSFPAASDVNAQIELPGSREASEVAAKNIKSNRQTCLPRTFGLWFQYAPPSAFSRAITAEDSRSKLCHDKQESISDYALDTAALLASTALFEECTSRCQYQEEVHSSYGCQG
ncbi:hypothetical protein [Parasitella parasitica]|uniref:Uncharacterized protein n=1 Tax=Parasitella parasitica TaxID=35722 RepID=A0A0B7N261_9FUNG|nr:hypothetical protein [Parasitella parasitica]